MRVFHITLAIAVTVTFLAAAAYERKVINDYMAYANHISRQYSRGDTEDITGWRQCIEAENTPEAVGVVCEGTRTLLIHGGHRADVNYFCEFQFKRTEPITFQVDHQLCQ